MVFNPTLDDGPMRRQPELSRASMFLLLLAAQLVLAATLFDADMTGDRAGFPNLLIRPLFAVSVAVAFDVVMLAVLLPLAPFSQTVPSMVGSRLERAAAVVSVTSLLLVIILFVYYEFFTHAGDAKEGS